ncbi:MAG: TlpA disulfide reductase family protein [Acidimicrobiales bacterium]
MNSPSVPPRPGSAAAKKRAQQQPTPQFKKAGAKPPAGNPLANPWVLGGIIGVVVLVLGVVAILSTTGGKDDDGDFSQNRPVTITGDALPTLPDPPADDPAVGLVAPTLAGQNFEGIAVDVDPGAPTLLVFVAHWCPHCQAEVPRLVQWNNDKRVPAGLRVVGVSTSVDERRDNYPPSDWLAREGFPWPVLADSEAQDAASAYGLPGFPYFVLLDADGKVLWRASGEISMDELDSILAERLAGNQAGNQGG